ncbi:hypothetical protein [Dickeya oryzae]|uniref:Uncharacterized protein n=1 Tax=Dickeya oryzae TaxID=1240404 RepID=A0AB39I6U3_9GAMM|nr:hypothetical protein [Dickeya oryzae]MCA6993912.1 hypothetical protein [Dickeya oryzae]
MTTKFLSMTYSKYSLIHTTSFKSKEQEYELNLQKVSEFNQQDSTLTFPNNYIFSKNGCWEISFDLVDNIVNRNAFAEPKIGLVSPITVMRTVERAILDHYNEFKAGMYIFLPDNEKLEAVYQRLLDRKLGKGFTLEMGLDPDGRGYVIRTPHCY